MKNRVFAMLLCMVLLLACLPVSAFAATIITRVELIIDLPVADRTPPNNCTILGNGYTIHSIDWEEISGRGFLESGEKFKEGYTYEATVWVKAADGYEFSNADKNTPAITGYINGESVHVTKAYEYNAWAMVCLTVQFHDIPAKGWIKNVNLSVPAPAAGEKPSYTQLTGVGYGTANVSFNGSSSDKMQNGIAWYLADGGSLKPGQDTFGENTSYTFRCLIFPQEGYKISEKAAVWVNGKEAEATLDYDTFLSVEYTFPATGKIPPTHTHSYMDWAWNSGQHYKNCTGCDEIFFAEDHKGGVATCSEKGKCTVCGYAYIEENETHNPDTSKWTACGDLYHAHLCKDCGAHAVTEDHKPGPDATETEPQKCTVCGYILTPAKNHTHALTLVPEKAPTCTEPGNSAYYTCDGCTQVFADAEGKTAVTDTVVAPLGHKISDDWKYDENNHWRTCTVCHQVLAETQLVHEMQNGKCATCGYGEENVPQDPKTTEPTPPPQQPVEEEQGLSWIWLVIAGAVCLAIGIAVPLAVVKRKKKTERTSL